MLQLDLLCFAIIQFTLGIIFVILQRMKDVLIACVCVCLLYSHFDDDTLFSTRCGWQFEINFLLLFLSVLIVHIRNQAYAYVCCLATVYICVIRCLYVLYALPIQSALIPLFHWIERVCVC